MDFKKVCIGLQNILDQGKLASWLLHRIFNLSSIREEETENQVIEYHLGPKGEGALDHLPSTHNHH